MMKTIRTAAAIAGASAALVAALAGCGTPVSGSAAPVPGPPPTVAATPTPAATDEEAVETVFRAYYQALIDRDFATACGFNAPETTEQLLAGLRGRGVNVSSCEQALNTIYATPGAAGIVEGIARSTTVEGVAVNGDQGSVTWSADLRGTRTTVTSELRRIGGDWKLVDTGA